MNQALTSLKNHRSTILKDTAPNDPGFERKKKPERIAQASSLLNGLDDFTYKDGRRTSVDVNTSGTSVYSNKGKAVIVLIQTKLHSSYNTKGLKIGDAVETVRK